MRIVLSEVTRSADTPPLTSNILRVVTTRMEKSMDPHRLPVSGLLHRRGPAANQEKHPPLPTEQTATIGGVATGSCDAAGVVNKADPREISRDSAALMTFAEVAAYLRISTRTLLRYIRDRKLEAYSVAGTRTRRIRRCDVGRLLVPLACPETNAVEDFIKSRTRVA